MVPFAILNGVMGINPPSAALRGESEQRLTVT
jgi:hypothetical protein